MRNHHFLHRTTGLSICAAPGRPARECRRVCHAFRAQRARTGSSRPRESVHARARRAGRAGVLGRGAPSRPWRRLAPLAGAGTAGGPEGESEGAGPVEPVAARRGTGRRPEHPGIRAHRRADRPQPARPHRVQLQRARHRQHGGAVALRQRGTEGTLAQAPAGRRDPFGVLHDRARRGLVGCHQHAGHGRGRRRRDRAQRPQVVVQRHRRPALQDRHLHGAHAGCRGRPPQPALHGAGAAGHAGRADRAHAAGVRRLRRAARPRRGDLHRRARAGGQLHRRARPGLLDRPGPSRPGPHPPLHALHRCRREGARADDRPWHAAHRFRQADHQPRRQPRACRRGAHRHRPGPPAHPLRGLEDGRRRHLRGHDRDLRDQGGGAQCAAAGGGHGDPDPRRRRHVAGHAADRLLRPGAQPAPGRRSGRGAQGRDREDRAGEARLRQVSARTP
ncbi:UNVERIFIED_CONTAM: hypothetical protein NCL1_08930 [Trichonephila clavipes]